MTFTQYLDGYVYLPNRPMKRFIQTLFILFVSAISFAQNPTYQQKLYYTCKIYGFVKYFHSQVSTCQVNWDSVLISRLPAIKNAVTKNDFNNALDTLLNAAGPMTIVPGVLPDTIAPALKRNRNFGWINDPIFRSDVKVILDTIKNNFRPHGECWVSNNYYTTSYYGWLIFPKDNPMSNTDFGVNFPDEWHRILVISDFWNVMNYFNPNNYIQDKPWDSTLFNNIKAVAAAANYDRFYTTFKKMTSAANDAHVEGFTWSTHQYIPGYYCPQIVLRYISNKYIVVKSAIPGIVKGDAILSVDYMTPTQMEDSLRPYLSSGNISVFRRFMCEYLFAGQWNTTVAIKYMDSLGVSHSQSPNRPTYVEASWFTTYYPNDTLANVHWKTLGCGIGYVNMGQLQSGEENSMYASLKNTPAIIFDLRNYPNGTLYQIASLMYPQPICFAKDIEPDTSYPGTFQLYPDYAGVYGNTSPYLGKVIILINQETQSQAEFTSMVLSAMPNSVKVGSQTAGADGNVSYFNLSTDISTGFTNLGIFYPNGDSTQRIGIVPDSVVYPTQVGIRHGRDEVLEKALQIANCALLVTEYEKAGPELLLYPNPADNLVHLEARQLGTNTINLSLVDLSGREIKNEEVSCSNGSISIEMDIHSLSSGMYFLQIKAEGLLLSRKIIKR
jgi:carboxyl-terminal processing protease